MFTLSSTEKYLIYSEATDMRKSFDGLSGLIRNELDGDPCSGDVFIFINKQRNKVKLLHWSSGCFTLYYRRLEEGTFQLPKYDMQSGSIKISYTQMVMLIDGLSIKNVHRRKRYVIKENCKEVLSQS